MRTSPRKTPGRGGFTLVELAAVLFIIGLILALAAPRLSSFGSPSRESVLRSFALAAEGNWDAALFTKRERRLTLAPGAGSWRFYDPEFPDDSPASGGWSPLVLDGIYVDGEEQPSDRPTEIVFRPGAVAPPLRIRLRGESGSSGGGGVWTLVLDPWTGTVDVREGDIVKQG